MYLFSIECQGSSITLHVISALLIFILRTLHSYVDSSIIITIIAAITEPRLQLLHWQFLGDGHETSDAAASFRIPGVHDQLELRLVIQTSNHEPARSGGRQRERYSS